MQERSMRRSVFLLTPLIPLAVAACEDGPAQTFTPASGTLFNNPSVPNAVSDAGDPLTLTVGGSTATQLCDGVEIQKQWGAMIAQPIAPVRYMAGLDMDDGPDFPLLTVERATNGPGQTIEMTCQPLNPNKAGTKCEGYNAVTDTAEASCAVDYDCQWGVHLIPNSPSTLPSRLCQPTVQGSGPNGGDVGGSLLVQWGNNGEFQMEWAIPTHKAYVLNLNPGYTGLMTWTAQVPIFPTGATKGVVPCVTNNDCTKVDPQSTCSASGSAYDGECVRGHYYDWQIGHPVHKDGLDFKINWGSSSVYRPQVDELYRGIARTFAPDIFDNAPAGTTCAVTGTCLAVSDAGDGTGRALFGMRPVSFYMFFNPPTLPDPSGYTVNSGYLFNIKYAPYSGITSYFKLIPDWDGGTNSELAVPFGDGFIGDTTDGGLTNPLADGGSVKAVGKHCHFSIGDDFQNLLDNCISVFNDPNASTTALKKVLGNLAHDDQDFTFAVVGINQNFRLASIDICPNPNGQGAYTPPAGSACGTRTQDVVHDTDTPAADPKNTFAETFFSDVRSFGAIQNDSYPNQAGIPHLWVKDWHGSGAVSREYARLVQTDLASQYAKLNHTTPKSLHDPSCYFPQSCQYVSGYTTGTGPQCGTATYSGCSGVTWTAATPATCSNDTDCGDSGGACNCNKDPNATDPGACAPVTPGGPIVPGVCQYNPCLWTTPPGFDANNWRPANGCTGFESYISAAEPIITDQAPTPADDVWDAITSGTFGIWGPALPPGGFARGVAGAGGNFKPGTPIVVFCNDPGTYDFCALTGDVAGAYGDLLNTSTARVLQYLGHGNVLTLPNEAQDRRYFFKQWVIANAKYMRSQAVLDLGLAAANKNFNITKQPGQQVHDFSHDYINTDDLIFDSYGGGASRGEFFDFTYADNSHDPVSLEEKILVIGSNLQATNFYRKLDREERALFNSLAVDRTQAAWGYIHDKSGTIVNDIFRMSPETACKVDGDCTGIDPNAACDVDPADALNGGFCTRSYARHNATLFLTNLAGSAALANASAATLGQTWLAPGTPAPAGWNDPCNPGAGTTCGTGGTCPGQLTCDTGSNTCVATKTAYYCAVNNDPECGANGSFLPPQNADGSLIVRENGKPYLAGYCSVWQPGPMALTSNSITADNKQGLAAATVVKTFPEWGEALVQMPSFTNPYDQASTVNTPVQVMVPWFPYQEGVGFPVATSGTRDVFVQTAQLEFAGQVFTPVMDILPYAPNDPNPNNPTPPYKFQIQAIETQDFLGEVFLCFDPVTTANRATTNVPGDILSAHMYSSAQTIIDWLAAHPGAQDACQIIVRYSPYDNYPDYITSLTNGVRLGVEQGAGFGRIADATVFRPGAGSPAAP
jgi:hypothetical protein